MQGCLEQFNRKEMTLNPEPYRTMKEAARLLNMPYFKVQRARKSGLIPTHKLLNSRPLVRVSEIEQAMKSVSDTEAAE